MALNKELALHFADRANTLGDEELEQLRDAVERVHEYERHLAETIHNYDIKGLSDGDGALNTGHLARTVSGHNKRADALRKRKADEAFYDTILMLDQLRAHAEWLDYQIEELDKRIAKTERQIEGLKDLRGKLLDGEEIELNADGTLQDQELEEAVQDFENEFGVEIDRQDPEALQRVVDYKKDLYSDLADKRDLYIEEKRDIEGIYNKIEAGGSATLTTSERELANKIVSENTSESKTLKAEFVARSGDAESNQDYFTDAVTDDFFDFESNSDEPSFGTSVANSISPTSIESDDLNLAFGNATQEPETESVEDNNPDFTLNNNNEPSFDT